MAFPAQAADEREIYLYYTHTKETIRIVYKRNGRFVSSALDRLNVFLRDWRRDEPAKMDPALYDILWEVYQQTGASQPIHIVSAYRSPQTNAMLASNSSGVADNSQHIKGKAIDFYIPGVPVSRIRELGFLIQAGGVGYYPSSGSPFVHLDTGSVRAWPRMTKAQLQQLFPDGRTMHIASNGQVLSQQGYQYAKAEWERCHRVPCSAGNLNGGTRVAESNRPRSLWDMITGGGNDDSQQQIQTAAAAPQPEPESRAPAATPAPVQQVAGTSPADTAPPAPPTRPANLIAATMVSEAPSTPETIPFQMVDAQQMVEQVAMGGEETEAPHPPAISRSLAEVRATNPSAYASGGARLELASAPSAPQPRPDFSPAVAASVEPAAMTQTDELAIRPSVAATSPEPHDELAAFAALFEGAIMPQSPIQADPATENAMASLSVAEGQFFTPELETVTQTLLAPSSLSSAEFAFPADDASTSVASADNPVSSSRFTRTAALGHSSTAFGPAETIWVQYDSTFN